MTAVVPPPLLDTRGLTQIFMRHREQKLGATTTGCSCGWTPPKARDAGLLRQWADHLADVVEVALGGPALDEHWQTVAAMVGAEPGPVSQP